jgi:N-acetylglutamate synthase-like GNAT family acetyltransferase
MTSVDTNFAPAAVAEPKAAPPAPPALDRADPIAERAAIEQFWTENFSSDSRRFSCYFNNPLEPGSIWVLRTQSGDVVGTTGLHTCRMVIDGHSHRAGHAVNLAIDPKYRTAGPAIQLQRGLLESVRHSGQSLVCGVTERAVAVLARAGYRQVGPLEKWTKVLRTAHKLQQYLKLPALAKCAGFGLDFALWGLSPEARLRRPPGWQVEFPEQFDQRFDRLWDRAQSQFPIATERSSKFLNWRFRDCCDDQFRTLCLSDANHELAGYVVYCRQGTTVRFLDLLCARPEDLEILVVEALRHVRSLRPVVYSVSVPYFGNGFLPSVLRRCGFRQRPEQNQLVVWANEEKLPLASLCDRNRWYLTAVDLL